MDENGKKKRATISDHVDTLDQAQVSREAQLRFKLKVDRDQPDDLISYNQLMEYLEDTLDTSLSKNTKVLTPLLTQNTLEVATTYLLNGRLGR